MDRRSLDRALAYVDSWLDWRCPRAGLPGCAVGVSWRGQLVFSGNYGCADLEARRPLRHGDVFRIASHSKTFAATSVLQLAERGALRLDDPVSRHLEWTTSHHDRRFPQVTLRQLLSHGAGLIRDGLDADFWQLGRRFPDRRQLKAELLEAELVTDPNVALKYSNFGYGLLGMVIEAVSGTSFADYVTEHICEPLGLSSTAAEPGPELLRRCVTGYGRRDAAGERRALPSVDTRALAAAGGFASTTEDLCTYFGAHFVGSKKLLSDASKREMQKVQWRAHRAGPGLEQEYGLGLQLEKIGARSTFGHAGGFPGHITRTFADPNDRLVVTVLTNCIDGPASDIARGIFTVIDTFCHEGLTPPARGLRRLEGRYVNFFSVNDLVVPGQVVLAANPESWDPLADPDRLERVDTSTLRVADDGSYGSTGELVHFDVREGKVESVRWAGSTMWPESRWPAAERRLARRFPGGRPS